MNKTIKLFSLLAVGTAFVGCTDYDYGVTADDFRKKKYAENFEKVFGTPDPNQDWSMAAYAKAVVNGMEDGTIELYYSEPIAGKAVLIAKRPVVDGQAEFNFNVVKGTKRIFARIKNAKGNYTLNRYFEIFDDEVYIVNEVTRAGGREFTGTSRVTKCAATTLDCPQLIDWTKSGQFHLVETGKASAVDYIDGYYADNAHDQNIAGKAEFYHTGTFENLYRLNDVISEDDPRPWWYVSDIAPFFTSIDGLPACFDEAVNHVVLMREGSNPKLEKDLVFEIEEGGSPFYLDYFFEGTDFVNDFGYFYFTGSNPTREQFMTMPKFIMVNDFAHNTTDETYINPTKTIPWNLLGMQGNYFNNTPGTGIAGISFAESNWDNKVVGTRLPLTYFGPDGTNETGTYEFPAGTKIGLFFIGYGNARENKIITSISKLNQDLYNEVPHAASFQLGDQVVFAMEDMNYGGDKDINDAMFIAHGNFNKTYIPNIIPAVEPEGQTWIMACEDLGGSHDYDFNDLVFGLRLTDLGDNTSNLDLIPLAAGGTLNAKIEYNGHIIDEIHNMVKPGAPTTTPINVTAGETPVKGQPIRLASGISSDTDIEDVAAQVKIIVTKGETTTNNVVDGKNVYNIGYDKNTEHIAPQVLLLPSGWDWPSEETLITKIYPEFEDWVASSTNPEAQTWCTTKAQNATLLVTNPLPAVTPSVDPENPSVDPGENTPVVNGTEEWNITITGEPVMGMNTSQTITISVEGLEDYSNVECGTYSSNIVTAAKVDKTQYTITGVTDARGVARFYVKVPGDADHAITRKVFEITVGDAVPEFYFYTTENKVNVRVTSGALTLPVHPTNNNVNLGIEVVKGFGTSITWSTSDANIVNVENNSLKRVACGTVTITATHAATDGGSNGSYSELSKSIELTIAKIDPEFTVASSVTVEEGKTVSFYATDLSVNNAISYSSDDPSIAEITTLNGGNAIRGVKPGRTKVYVTMASSDFYNSLTKEVDVEVTESSLPEAQFTVSPTTIGMEVGGTAQIATINLIRGDRNSFSISIDDPTVVELVGNFNSYNPNTIRAKAMGTAHITITHAKTNDYKSHSEMITVKVGTAVWGDPIDITSRMSEVTSTTDPYFNNIKLITVDMSDFDWSDAVGVKLRITGSSDGQVCVTDANYLSWDINRQLFDNGIIEGETSHILGAGSFPLFTYGSTFSVTKLELIKKTISTE